jgi:hypothetical protein
MIHGETPLKIDIEINNKKQDYKIGTVGCSTDGKGENEWNRSR